MRNHSILERTDSYKLTHWLMLKSGLSTLISYQESRGGIFPNTLYCGGQVLLKKYLLTPFTKGDIDYMEWFSDNHFRQKGLFNRAGFEYILSKHGGLFPLEIKAVPEGTIVPGRNVLMTIENTDKSLNPSTAFISNYIETIKSKIWASTTVATNSYYCKQLIKESMIRTGSDLSGLRYMLHDFGYRGTPEEDAAAFLGCAHLINFEGSDNIAGINEVLDYYNWNMGDGFPAYSVPASEHSISTMYGRDGEKEYMMMMLTKFPAGPVSVVTDTYNTHNFLTMCHQDEEIKTTIMNRDGVTVLRLDSGIPCDVIRMALDNLWKGFGGTYTPHKYKLLDSHVRILQGDGIDYQAIGEILTMMENAGYATSNIIFGSGGGLLQKFDRDTLKFAIKGCFAVVHGNDVNLQKDPITSSMKKSKTGRLKLHKMGEDKYMTISSADYDPAQFAGYTDSLVPIFRNGELLKDYSFREIRGRANF